MQPEAQKSLDRQKNTFLNFIKGCACIGVVWIHVLFPGMFGTIVHKASQFAVPIFLMISGYYAYSADGDAYSKIKRRCKRIAVITVYAFFLYLAFTLFYNYFKHDLTSWLGLFRSLKVWAEIILLGDLDLIWAKHLWFLPAQIISYLILMYIDKKNLYALAYKLLPYMIFGRIIVSSIVSTCGMNWHLKLNFLVGALPWMILGNYLAYNQNLKNKFSNRNLILALAVGGILAVGASVLFVLKILPIELSEVGNTLYSVALFILAIKNPEISISKSVEKLGENYSLYVYILHLLVAYFVGFTAKFAGIYYYSFYDWVHPVIVVILSIIASMILYRVINRSKSIGK